MKNIYLFMVALGFSTLNYAQPKSVRAKSDKLATSVEAKVIEWRHYFHQNPELSNREFETAKIIAAHLRSLDIDVQEGVAKTGVVGILKGDKPGPVVALRADIDGLPVTERVDLEWSSKVKSTYNNIETGVMHACGHDTHTAILMGVAEVLSKMKGDIKGTVKFIFQPAEEGSPPGEEGGAKLMVKEGVLKNPDVDVVFGLHIQSYIPVGVIKYRYEGTMAAADRWVIKIKGKQSHGSKPWDSVDPIMVSAMIINNMQTIISRQTDITKQPAVLSVGLIRSGIRNNIIPEEAEMIGTIRTLDVAMQEQIHASFRKIATGVAESMGAEIEMTIEKVVPVTYNHPELTNKSIPWLQNAAGLENVMLRGPQTGAEDFSFFANEVPGFYFFVGGCPEGCDTEAAAPHHTPDFYVDDAGMITGIKAMLNLTLGYMNDPLK